MSYTLEFAAGGNDQKDGARYCCSRRRECVHGYELADCVTLLHFIIHLIAASQFARSAKQAENRIIPRIQNRIDMLHDSGLTQPPAPPPPQTPRPQSLRHPGGRRGTGCACSQRLASAPDRMQNRSAHEPAGAAEDVVNGLAQQGNEVVVPMARRLRLSQLTVAVWHDGRRHHLQVFAGDLAYNAFLALIPFMLFVGLVLRSVHADDLVNGAVGMFGMTLPASSAGLLQDQIQAEVTSRVPDWWLLGVLLAAGSLWACSALFRAVTLALNVMYEGNDDRSVLGRLATSVLFALGSAATWLILFAIGETLARAAAGISSGAAGPIWAIVMLFGGFAFCASVYRLVPSDRRAFRAIVPGAVCAAASWFVFSMVFEFVMNRFGQILVDPLYGWFTGLFGLVLYLYWSAYIFLLGAEVNHAIEAKGA